MTIKKSATKKKVAVKKVATKKKVAQRKAEFKTVPPSNLPKREIKIKPLKRVTMIIPVVGTSSLIQHKWSAKAEKEMRDKKMGVKSKEREPCNPEQEYMDACYITDNGEHGIPLMAFKKAILMAAHKDFGIPRTDVAKAIYVESNDSNLIEPMRCSEPVMREDHVKVGKGQPDLRYRPEFKEWGFDLTVSLDVERMLPEELVNLINRAGFQVGICEWRPERHGDHGRFEIDMSRKIKYLA